MSKPPEDIYDVNSYTDAELYNILDLVNPTDRELEAQIISYMNKYANMQNESGDKLYSFFNDIYNHFFETEEEEEEEIIHIPVEETRKKVEGFENNSGSGPSTNNVELVPSSDAGNKKSQTQSKQEEQYTSINYTKQLDFSRDKLNPLLKQTITRIISIDSQYRDKITNPLSTDFTFNLSEYLKDVVALKLYSIQIPYTWYTISNNFGSNFFYLKGNVDGLNNGNHDFKIEISAGNYTPTELIRAINLSIGNLTTNIDNTINYDVSFGTTNISYNTANSIATITIDMQQLFNESYYYLYFPYWISPYDIVNRNNSIPSFFGFDASAYLTSYILSDIQLPLTTVNDNTIYDISSNNNYFTIIQYENSINELTNKIGNYVEGTSRIIDTITIQLNTNVLVPGNQYTRTQIINEVNTQLQINPKLIESSFQRIDVLDPSKNGFNESYMKMNIKMNRLKIKNTQNSKLVVVFPEETVDNPVWTGEFSAFQFLNRYNEVSLLTSETNTLQTNYPIVSSPYIKLVCIRPYYGYTSTDDPDNKVDVNDYTITVPNYDPLVNIDGYLLNEYIAAINQGIASANTLSISNRNTRGELFNTVFIQDQATSKSKLTVEINKVFNYGTYTLDLSGSTLYTLLGLDQTAISSSYSKIDLSLNNVFVSEFPISGAGYTITSDFLFKINPKTAPDFTTYGNQYAPQLYISNTNKTTFGSYTTMQDYINSVFRTYIDSDGDQPIRQSTIAFTLNAETITSTLTIIVNKSLNYKDYSLEFYDPSNNTFPFQWTSVTNSWYNYLQFGESYYILNNYADSGGISATIFGANAIFSNIIRVTSINNEIILKPMTTSDGIYTTKNTNDIRLLVPYNTSIGYTNYTRDELINTINQLLYNDVRTRGSYFTVISVGLLKYSQFRININKIYTAKDYKLVFYDPFSFVTCTSALRTISNTTWDSTLGWILGFRDKTEYELSIYSPIVNSTYILALSGDTVVSVNIYNYFLIVLDDFNQNHLNDGLVTSTQKETDLPLPSYASRATQVCDPVTGKVMTSNTSSLTNNNLTQRQIYAAQSAIDDNGKSISKTYSTGPFVKDVFGLIPMKVSGMANNSTYIEFGGTLQQQERLYFGPVNIHRMRIQLIDDRGNKVNLNGANWSFSLVCQQLYQEKPTSMK